MFRKEEMFRPLERLTSGIFGQLLPPHVLFCYPAFLGAGLPPSLQEDTQSNLMLAHHC